MSQPNYPIPGPSRATIAEYPDYFSAQSAVDRLSDAGFEVGSAQIVGHDLKSVENVRGRMTYGKAALYGAGSGAWFGLLIGLLIALFVPVGFFGVLLGGVIIGAVWGLIFGIIGFSTTGNLRNFHSDTVMEATRYTLEVPSDRARAALTVLAGGPGPQQTSGNQA